MNYLTEILAFYKWLEQRPLTPLLQAYWQLLMFWNNRAAILGEDDQWYWRVNFNVPNTAVMAALGLKNRQAVWTQRRRLIMTQRIIYTPDAGRNAGNYALIPFDKGLAQVRIRDKERHHPTLVWTQTVTQALRKGQPYINTINYKPTSLLCNTKEGAESPMGFNLLPQLSDEERAAIELQYPKDSLGRFEALWKAREKKQMEKDGAGLCF